MTNIVAEIGTVKTQLNGAKGMYCCFCRKARTDNFISIYSDAPGGFISAEAHTCPECAKNLITCLQQTLVQILLKS